MSATTLWVAVIAAGVLSCLIRVLPALLLAGREPSDLAVRAGGLVAPVAFAVLATTALVHLAGSASGVAGLAWPGAAVATGVVVAIWRGGLALPILTGMAVMWLSALLA